MGCIKEYQKYKNQNNIIMTVLSFNDVKLVYSYSDKFGFHCAEVNTDDFIESISNNFVKLIDNPYKFTEQDMLNAFSRRIGLQTLSEKSDITWLKEYKAIKGIE